MRGLPPGPVLQERTPPKLSRLTTPHASSNLQHGPRWQADAKTPPVLPNPRRDVLQSRHVNAMHRLLLTLALSAALASIAFAQTAETIKPPDVSGKWKLNLSKSTLKSKLQPETITITTDTDQIQFHHSGEPKDRLKPSSLTARSIRLGSGRKLIRRASLKRVGINRPSLLNSSPVGPVVSSVVSSAGASRPMANLSRWKSQDQTSRTSTTSSSLSVAQAFLPVPT